MRNTPRLVAAARRRADRLRLLRTTRTRPACTTTPVHEIDAFFKPLAWDGDWYRRAYFDDGTPLGSVQNEECKIDSLTQSWAVISRAAQPPRAERAMNAVRAHLVRRDARLVLLLTPPFDQTPQDPGYIKAIYPASARTVASTRTPRSGR